MTYQDIHAIVKGKELPVCGKNEDAENVIIEKGKEFYKIATAQHNGWTRINLYYRNGMTEETYKRSV